MLSIFICLIIRSISLELPEIRWWQNCWCKKCNNKRWCHAGPKGLQLEVRARRFLYYQHMTLTAKPSTFDPIVLYIIGHLCIWRIRIGNSGGKSIWNAKISRRHPDRFATINQFLVISNLISSSSLLSSNLAASVLWLEVSILVTTWNSDVGSDQGRGENDLALNFNQNPIAPFIGNFVFIWHCGCLVKVLYHLYLIWTVDGENSGQDLIQYGNKTLNTPLHFLIHCIITDFVANILNCQNKDIPLRAYCHVARIV